MKALRIADSATVVLGLQDEIRRSEESRYDHRLHGVLLGAQGLTCPEVAALLGDASRSVEYWVRRFEDAGLAGLQEGERPGRPPRLSPKQLGEVDAVLRKAPREVGMAGNLWDGKTLAAWIERQYGAPLGGTPVSESISTIGIPFTQTASNGGAGGPATPEGA
jgi:transposase